MKKILSLIAALLLTSIATLQATVIVYTVPAGAVPVTNIVAGAARINTITVFTGSSGGVTNLTYAFTDQPGLNVTNGWGFLKQTNGLYTNIVSYTTNIVRITTNFSGVLYTNTIQNALYTYTNIVTPTSNDWRRIAVGNVGSNSTVTITGPFPVIYGLSITNLNIGKDIIVTVDYDASL